MKNEKSRDCAATVVEIGGEKVLYVTLPYRGCTRYPKCLFCAVREREDRTIKPDEVFGREVFSIVSGLIDKHSPDSLVLYIGGNILRPEEMYQPVIIEEIPKLISTHPTCKTYELESRADDILLYQKSIQKIKNNLKCKKLRMRLGIEYFDDNLLWRHRKGIAQAQIVQAVNCLNESETEWNGYVMLGGLDMNMISARTSAKKTAKFMIDSKAFKVSINGMFVTKKLESEYGRRIYVPTYSDLMAVLGELLLYCKNNQKTALFKVGFEEEDVRCMVRIPFLSAGMKLEELKRRLALFNKTQDIESLKTREG